MNTNAYLPTEWFQRAPEVVARELVGCELFVQHDDAPAVRVRVVETEAYLSSHDKACHAARGMTPRNAPMFSDGGVFYVYYIYGMHLCANVVTEREGHASAVLLRAGVVVDGEDTIRERRGQMEFHKLLRGPGNFCRGVGLQLRQNNQSCAQAHLHFSLPAMQPQVLNSTRIGVVQDADLLLRFFEKGQEAVSAHKRGTLLKNII